MKKFYTKPEMKAEEFVANTYVAACGTFNCNAPIVGNSSWDGHPTDQVYYWAASRFRPENGESCPPVSSYSGSTAKKGTLFYPCGMVHTSKTISSSQYYLGYIDRDNDTQYDEGEEVVVWLVKYTDGDSDTHCTNIMDTTSWKNLKS